MRRVSGVNVPRFLTEHRPRFTVHGEVLRRGARVRGFRYTARLLGWAPSWGPVQHVREALERDLERDARDYGGITFVRIYEEGGGITSENRHVLDSSGVRTKCGIETRGRHAMLDTTDRYRVCDKCL